MLNRTAVRLAFGETGRMRVTLATSQSERWRVSDALLGGLTCASARRTDGGSKAAAGSLSRPGLPRGSLEPDPQDYAVRGIGFIGTSTLMSLSLAPLSAVWRRSSEGFQRAP